MIDWLAGRQCTDIVFVYSLALSLSRSLDGCLVLVVVVGGGGWLGGWERMQLPPPLQQSLTHKHNQPIPDGQRRMAMRCPIHMTTTTTKRKKTIAQKRRHPNQPHPLVCLRRRQQIPLGGAPRGARGCAGVKELVDDLTHGSTD